MVRPDRRVLIIGRNFVHLHELMQLRFGVLNGPVAMNASVHIERFGLFHSLLLLCPIDETMSTRTIVVVIVERAIRLAQGLRTIALLQWHRESELRLSIERDPYPPGKPAERYRRRGPAGHRHLQERPLEHRTHSVVQIERDN